MPAFPPAGPLPLVVSMTALAIVVARSASLALLAGWAVDGGRPRVFVAKRKSLA